MNGGTIDVKLRPIKLAFLVEPTDRKAILEAMQISSFLWGGIYNPIIPIFSRAPKVWKKGDPISRYKGKEILAGYLEAYNPDYVVPVGRCVGKKLDVGNREIISVSEILSGIDEDGTAKYGVGLFEILSDFYSKELKYKRKKPLEFYLFKLPKQGNLFFTSVFGSLPEKINKIVDEHWAEHLEAHKEKVSFSNFGEFLKPGKLFIRRLLYQDIETRGGGGIRGGNCLFFMDANNTHDIIDFWNLRALGWIVVPIAKQGTFSDSTKQLAKSFVEEHSGMSKWNNYYIRATVMRARSVDEKLAMEFMKGLDIAKDEKSEGSRWVFQHWYPRLWDEWARDKDGAVCSEIEVSSNGTDYNGCQESVSVRTVDPSFVARFGGHGSPRYANVIEIRTYCNDDIYAEVIPDSGSELTRVLSGIGLREWRFTRKESVFLVQHSNWRIHIPIPKAEDVFRAWLKDNGLDAQLSSSGKIAKQMVKQLGGTWGLATISNEELIGLLRDMEDGKVMEKDAFWGRISKIANNSKFVKREPAEVLKRYMDIGMFRLGATIQCPICSHRSWFTVDNLDYKLRCVNCLDNFDLPSHSPDEIKWSYRTFGPFSLCGSAEGSYSTLLVLRLFSKILDGAVTPMMSFLTKIDGAEKEIDLGLLLRESSHNREGEVRPVFAECKTYNKFEKSDVDKLDKLAERFPGSIIVFATLRDSLTDKEKKLLKPLVNKCRRYWKADKPHNHVLILTKTELFADLSIDYAWKDASDEKYKKFAERTFYTDRLLHICDATQQLYLGMRPWHDEIREKFEKKRQPIKKEQPPQTQQTV
jgi:hypothetical protein